MVSDTVYKQLLKIDETDNDPSRVHASWNGSQSFEDGILSYSFDQLPWYYGTLSNPSPVLSGLVDVSTITQALLDQKTVINNLLSSTAYDPYRVSFSDVTNLNFENITGVSVGDISIQRAELISDAEEGLAFIPLYAEFDTFAGDIWLDVASANELLNEGQIGYWHIIHELAHSVGLNDVVNTPLAGGDKDSHQYTIMSYNFMDGMNVSGTSDDVAPSGLQLYDIAALQQIYGANTTTRQGDTTYKMGGNQAFGDTASDAFIYTIWDGGGDDTIDATRYGSGVQIDLREGHFSSIGDRGDGQAVSWDVGDYDAGNVAIAYDTVIENATGTQYADHLIGNDADNILNGGAGDDVLEGGIGDDQLYGGAGKDSFIYNLGDGNNIIHDFDFGLDTLVFGSNITTTNLEFQEIGNDLKITFASDQSLTLKDAAKELHTIDIQFEGFENSNFQLLGVDTLQIGDERDNILGNYRQSHSYYDPVILLGGGGSDRLYGFNSSDYIDGGDGDDWLYNYGGGDTVIGGAGNDYITMFSKFAGDIEKGYGGTGDDTYRFDDYLYVTGSVYFEIEDISGDDKYTTYFRQTENITITDHSGNDEYFITTSGQSNIINDYGGNDYYQVGNNNGIVEINDNSGNDTLYIRNEHLSGFSSAYRLNDDLVIKTIKNYPVYLKNYYENESQQIEKIRFYDTEYFELDNLLDSSNVLFGSNEAEEIIASSGNTKLLGFGGDDNIHGGEGNDILTGGAGNDQLFGGSGDDTYTFAFGDGINTITEESGFDIISLGAGITMANVSFEQIGNDLNITIASGFRVTNFFSGNTEALVEQLQFEDGSTFDLTSLIAQDINVQQDSASGDEDGGVVTGNVLGNDIDPNGQALSVKAMSFDTLFGGHVELLANGDYTYTPAADFNGQDHFSYTVMAEDGREATGSVFLTINAVNDAPIAQNDAVSGDEDSAITGNLLDNDTDIDGDVLIVNAATITTARGGVVELLENGNFTYNPAANFHGDDSFEYTVTDAAGEEASAVVSLTINPVNDAPNAEADFFGTEFGVMVNGSVLANDSDIDGDALSIQAQTLLSVNGGAVELLEDGSFTYTPAEGFSGVDSFDYTLLDGQGGEASATVQITVGEAPVEEGIVGDEAANDLAGTDEADLIKGLGGEDTLLGGQGDDTLYGGEGDDILYGGAGETITLDKDFIDSITFPELKERINISNLKPPGDPSLGVNEGNLDISFDSTAELTFRKGHAGYNNTLGIYRIAEDGKIEAASILWENVKNAGIDQTHTIDLPLGAEGGEIGFFILSDGDRKNNYGDLDTSGEGNIRFVYDFGGAGERDATIHDSGADITVLYDDGSMQQVLSGAAYHTTARDGSSALNADGKEHVVSGLAEVDNDDVFRIGFEDLPCLGDADYEDVLFDLNINPVSIEVGNDGNDILYGGAGDDQLFGEAGNDILFMGEGRDEATGGSGSDTFVFDQFDAMADTIFGFETGVGGDVINLTDVLSGYDPLSGAIADFVQVTQNGDNTEIKVSADGAGEFVTIAVIEGVSEGVDLASLLGNGNLVLDQSVAVAI